MTRWNTSRLTNRDQTSPSSDRERLTRSQFLRAACCRGFELKGEVLQGVEGGETDHAVRSLFHNLWSSRRRERDRIVIKIDIVQISRSAKAEPVGGLAVGPETYGRYQTPVHPRHTFTLVYSNRAVDHTRVLWVQ
jgi:hypothetical protein